MVCGKLELRNGWPKIFMLQSLPGRVYCSGIFLIFGEAFKQDGSLHMLTGITEFERLMFFLDFCTKPINHYCLNTGKIRARHILPRRVNIYQTRPGQRLAQDNRRYLNKKHEAVTKSKLRVSPLRRTHCKWCICIIVLYTKTISTCYPRNCVYTTHGRSSRTVYVRLHTTHVYIYMLAFL